MVRELLVGVPLEGGGGPRNEGEGIVWVGVRMGAIGYSMKKVFALRLPVGSKPGG